MVKSQTAVLARIETETRPEPALRSSDVSTPVAPPRERKPAERIRDALLQWLEEEA
ncbi:MAG TPA: hypothetical protein VLT61_07885 [Anaeromyxobacteraceae bacterium]|nr:hypothetical protein [Anaeromyxobacteraceae bacterium]